MSRRGTILTFVGKYGLDGAPLPEKSFDFWRGFAGQGESFPKGESGPHMLFFMTDQERSSSRVARPGGFEYEHHFRYNRWIPATEGIRATDWKYTRYMDEQPCSRNSSTWTRWTDPK